MHWSTLDVFHDLKERRYLVNGLDNRRNSFQFSEEGDFREFSPRGIKIDTCFFEGEAHICVNHSTHVAE